MDPNILRNVRANPSNHTEWQNKVRSTCEVKMLEYLRVRYPLQKIETQHSIRTRTPYYSGSLFLDFFIPDLSLAVEVDGPQHFVAMKFFHSTFQDYGSQKLRDMAKDQWCAEHNIRLIRVSHVILGNRVRKEQIDPLFTEIPEEDIYGS